MSRKDGDKNWLEEGITCMLSSAKELPEDQQEELRKYAKDPKGYIDNVRNDIANKGVAKQIGISQADIDRHRRERDEEDRRRQDAIDSTLED